MPPTSSRRHFIRQGATLCTGYFFLPQSFSFTNKPVSGFQQKQPLGKIMSVNGPLSETGFTLAHEHIMVDFIGAGKVSTDRYAAQEVFDAALPKLVQLKATGCKTFVDCTPAYLGRDVKLLQRLSAATGLNIITNTGYYGAAKEKYLPKQAYDESAEQIADRWIAEYENGIDNSKIKPGFIKCAVDGYPLSAVQSKMIEAAALTHLATGLTIYVHTGSGAAAKEEMSILKKRKVHPSAWVWVHAQSEKSRAIHFEIARAGGWVSFDGVSTTSIATCIQFLSDMKKEKLLGKVLLSQDSGWYNVGEPNGGKFNGYTTIHDLLIPEMKKTGFTDSDLTLLFEENPANALRIGVKKVS